MAVTLAPGAEFGPYQIQSLLGKGGMGEVWRARDTRLAREVAVKTLPAEYARDPESRARFQQEARALAALNHPNVGAIYGLEERDGAAYLILELVEGPTLAGELVKGALPVERALAVGAQIAAGVEAAHDAGIIHRDLKPANVKIRPDGSVKVLDFGLARTLGLVPQGATPEVTVLGATMPGVVLGTFGYMSPEQARGTVVDRRTDIFSFGCVLFECLAGRPAFGGATATDALSATLTSEPEWQLVPDQVPPSVRDLLRRCLHKDPRRRLQSIGDARVILEEPLVPAAPPPVSAARPTRNRWREWAMLVACGAVAGVVIGWRLPRRETDLRMPGTVRAELPMPAKATLALGQVPTLAISPDGQTVVFRANDESSSRLYRRALGGSDAEAIAGTEGGLDPFFSPDGQWLAFFAQSRLKKVSMAGGAPVLICDVPPVASGGTWTTDGWIVFSRGPNFALSRVSPSGGAVEAWSHLDPARGERAHAWPQALPHGRVLVTMVFGRDFQDLSASRAVIVTPGEPPRDIQEGSAFARIVPGYLVFVRGDAVLAAPFDEQALQVTGPAVRVSEQVSIATARRVPHLAVSTDGTLVYGRGAPVTVPPTDVVRVDATGRADPLPIEPGTYNHVRVSPDRTRVMVARTDGMAMRLFVFDLTRRTLSPVTPEAGRHFCPVWSPDGRRIAYAHFESSNPQVYVRSVDGSDTPAALTESTDYAAFPNSWSPDGRVALFTAAYTSDLSPTRRRGTSDIWLLPMDGSAPARPWFESPQSELAPAFSPDGRFVAYVSNESGRAEVYVRPFPGPGGKIQVSSQGGTEPAWVSNGQQILYRSGDRFLSAAFRAGPDAVVAASRELFSSTLDRSSREDDPRAYDASPDGSVLVALRSVRSPAPARSLSIVTNWTATLFTPVNGGREPGSR